MGWYVMFHLHRNGDEPPPRTIANCSTHDLAAKAERLGHVDRSQLGNADAVPIDRKFVISKVEAQSVLFLAFEPWEATFLPILAWMLELGKRPFLLHPPVVVKSLSQMAKLLFGSAFRDLIAPGKLLALDPVILCLEVFDLGPCSLCTVVFPTSKRPVIGMTCHPTSFAEIHLLFWSWMKPDYMRAIHVINLLSRLCAGQHLAVPALSAYEPVLAVQADRSSLSY